MSAAVGPIASAVTAVVIITPVAAAAITQRELANKGGKSAFRVREPITQFA